MSSQPCSLIMGIKLCPGKDRIVPTFKVGYFDHKV